VEANTPSRQQQLFWPGRPLHTCASISEYMLLQYAIQTIHTTQNSCFHDPLEKCCRYVYIASFPGCLFCGGGKNVCIPRKVGMLDIIPFFVPYPPCSMGIDVSACSNSADAEFLSAGLWCISSLTINLRRSGPASLPCHGKEVFFWGGVREGVVLRVTAFLP
jgi:hypothetical protein